MRGRLDAVALDESPWRLATPSVAVSALDEPPDTPPACHPPAAPKVSVALAKGLLAGSGNSTEVGESECEDEKDGRRPQRPSMRVAECCQPPPWPRGTFGGQLYRHRRGVSNTGPRSERGRCTGEANVAWSAAAVAS